jgi:quinoprotein relay system zinc metallohydrolase 1
VKLRRRAFLAGALALPVVAHAEQYAGTYAPEATAIGDGIWLVRGADDALRFENGGAVANSVFMASDAGTILFDPGPSLKFGKALAVLAERIAGKPVALVYVSHLHPDHAFGSGAFPETAIHSLPATRRELERDGSGFSDGMYRLLSGWMTGTEVVPPQGDLAEGPAEFGGRKLELLALSGHSEGDLALVDHASGTLVAGDTVFCNRAPATPNADFAVWRTSLDRLETIPHRQLVPGHGPLDREGKAIAQTRDWLIWLEGALRCAVSSGLDMTEAGAMDIPARFAGMKAARYELQRSVSHFYPRFETELFPRIDG